MAFLFLSAATAGAQEGGTISGVVVNTWDGAPLPAVVITLRGTTLATQTGADGKFELRDVPTGDQVMRFSRSGFATAVVTDVRVLPGQTTTVNGNLRPEFHEMEEYEVTAEEFTEQTEEILLNQRESGALLDAMGSDMFKNLAVSDAAGALSKVTGASVADGKYAVIRGLADRYTFTTLNGMELPSADPDRKAFQLDLMPSRFIEQLDVRKTFTPDMSGGFAGGAIDIISKSFPDDFLFELRLSTAYNTQSSLRDDFASSKHGSTDWLGFDDGSRDMPAEAAATSPTGTQVLPDNVKRSFRSTQFAPIAIDSPLDSGMSLLIGDTDQIFGKRLGYLGGFNYKNEYQYYDDGKVRTFAGANNPDLNKTETRGVIEYQWGALANLSLELSEEHELKFNFLFIQAAQDEAGRLQGQDPDVSNPDEGTHVDQSVLHWTERNLVYYQLAGDHRFPELKDVRLEWGGALSTTTQAEPDYRIFQFLADPANGLFNPDTSIAEPARPTRYWRDLQEDGMSVRGDLTFPFPSYNSGENFLKTGVAVSVSQREYNQRGFEYSRRRGAGTHPFYTEGDPNNYITDENLQYLDLRNFSVNLSYEGEQQINAGYLMADWSALEWVRLIGGARLETTDISVTASNLSNPSLTPPSGSIRQTDILPSVTAIVQLRPDVDVRAAWSRTVVRPTYREIARVEVYDVTQNRVYYGNPGLVPSASENFDLRASWYPRPGEVVSISGFAKFIDLPIELSTDAAQDASQITFVNSEKADVFGIEGELRLRLDRVWEPLAPFSVGVNAAYIESEVPLTAVQRENRSAFGDFSTTRPLYNQPKYIVNADLTWNSEWMGTSVTVSGGVVGERLVLANWALPDEYEQPAPELNVFVRQRLGQHWDVRFTARNLFDPPFEIAQNWPGAGQRVLRSYRKGMTFGLSVGCEF